MGSEMEFPALHKMYKATDNITDRGQTVASVLDYWIWAHSDIMDNAERGTFAEFLISKAVGDKSVHRVNWEKYDVTSSEGIHIEVKTSAYLQAWGQNKLSALKFGIGRTYGYNYETNSYDSESKRQADVYVFCVLKETDQKKLDLLNTAQWDFYVLASWKIDNDPYYSDKNSISLAPLIRLGAIKCQYADIHKEVVRATEKE